MKQPDLGSLVAELRAQKGLTQEKLAEYCEVSTRTIQRIEQGEVEPRPFTLNSLSNILDFDFNSEQKDGTVWLALLHLSSVLCIVAIPLVIWSWKKNRNHKIDQQGRMVLNFQITMTVVLIGLTLGLLLLSGGVVYLEEAFRLNVENAYLAGAGLMTLPMILLGFFITWQGIRNAVRAVAGDTVHYPLSIPFLR